MPKSKLKQNIIDSLVPILDSIRGNVAALVGDHQYRLYAVTRTWTGARVGEGTASEVETEIVPVPIIVERPFYSSQDYGRQEEGTVKASKVSLTYTEAELNPAPASNQEFFYRLKDNLGQAIANDEFVLAGQPMSDRAHTIGWILQLKRAQK